jgi:hypothetical protein
VRVMIHTASECSELGLVMQQECTYMISGVEEIVETPWF